MANSGGNQPRPVPYDSTSHMSVYAQALQQQQSPYDNALPIVEDFYGAQQ